jgi:uncharacterized membrane protein YgcG
VLLLVAPKERKSRIEVGYGLEGTLTDALAKIVITNAMVPRFKSGDFGGGIERGVDDIITRLDNGFFGMAAAPRSAHCPDVAPEVCFGIKSAHVCSSERCGSGAKIDLGLSH